MIILTPRQKLLLKEGMRKRYILRSDFYDYYTSQPTKVLRRFLDCEIMFQTSNWDVFELNPNTKELKKLLK